MGASSTMSMPRRFLPLVAFSQISRACHQLRPPGSGVPVAGMREASRPSTSKVR